MTKMQIITTCDDKLELIYETKYTNSDSIKSLSGDYLCIANIKISALLKLLAISVFITEM